LQDTRDAIAFAKTVDQLRQAQGVVFALDYVQSARECVATCIALFAT